MRLLHVVETMRGGCGTYLNEILPLQIREFGIDGVRAIVPRQHLAQLADVDPRILLPFDRGGRLSGAACLTLALIRHRYRWRPDLIHAHSSFAGAIVRFLGIFGIMPPIVYCPHGWAFEIETSSRSRGLIRFVERRLSRFCASVIAISAAEMAQGRSAGIDGAKLRLVPNGIHDVPLRPPAPGLWNDDRLKVLFVGRLDRQKGVDILLDAVAGMEKTVSVRIVGESVASASTDGSAPAALPHVTQLGWLDHASVAEQTRACDIVVMPSRWEGFGLVAVEAMRAGKPVLASAVGGLPEIIDDGVTGSLFPVGDSKRLAELIEEYGAKDLEPAGLASRARFLALFTSDKTHDALLKVYAGARPA